MNEKQKNNAKNKEKLLRKKALEKYIYICIYVYVNLNILKANG